MTDDEVEERFRAMVVHPVVGHRRPPAPAPEARHEHAASPHAPAPTGMSAAPEPS